LAASSSRRAWRLKLFALFLAHPEPKPTLVQGGAVGPHYASSKSALHGMMHWMATRYGLSGVTANVVAPGPVADTAMGPSADLIDSLKSSPRISRA
jgi:NAD(P)-dependent dehydrogenase (short-subunit alcohol dehydrogenase family)